ncbi:MAG: bifunctional 3-deoxy-7-phosphoheptulonate synthase/chorismate mutase type II [Kiritimatiellales bacterium]|nr:bifunctional 3-deoxy-7-phosphoheptulonate synthase/chorismate mutase type II [Kiritimatiellales bacterium]
MNMDITPLKDWGLPIDKMFLIAGPCSAETEEQVLETARALADDGVSIMRAGIWKPRTRPGSFEGVGLKGLAWLDRARQETGLKVCTEVAEPAHVEACLEFNIDMVWIGARTTPNPFAIQALADALKGVDIPVLVKNPVNADIGLWVGALERIHNAGINKLGVIHRGFSSTREMVYRNNPNWKIPIEFKRKFPQVPMVCDPSHICGDSKLIFGVAQEAMDLLYDGLMVEVHPNPPEAWSDAKQQLTPAQLMEMMAQLNLSHEESESRDFQQRMEQLRREVDGLDNQLLDALSSRMNIVREMGRLKREQNVSTLQPHRWNEIVQDRVEKGANLSLSNDFVLELMQAVHEEAIRQQEADRIAGSN